MKRGYTKSYRKELSSDIWLMPPLYHRVWFYLRSKAQWEKSIFPTRKHFGIHINPGQIITSIDLIAEGVKWTEWGVEKKPNKKTIRDVLTWLEGNAMVTVESNANGTLINITNWDTYNDTPDKKVTLSNHDFVTQEKRLLDTIKELEELKRTKDKKKEKREYPDWLDNDLWLEFRQMRIRIKAPLTDNAEKRAIAKLKSITDRGYSQQEILERSIDNCWKGFFEPKHEGSKEPEDNYVWGQGTQ